MTVLAVEEGRTDICELRISSAFTGLIYGEMLSICLSEAWELIETGDEEVGTSGYGGCGKGGRAGATDCGAAVRCGPD